MTVMTPSLRILALILVTLVAPWILRDQAGKGITSADAVFSTSLIVESRSGMKNASVVNVKNDLVGEYWGKSAKPQNSHNITPLTQSSRDLRRYHRSRLVFKSSQHSRRKAELLERKRRRDLRARGYKVHASTASNEPLGKNSNQSSSTEGSPNNSASTSRYPLRIIRKYFSLRGNKTGTRQLMLCFNLKDAEGNAFVLSASLSQPPKGRRPIWKSSAVYALPNTPHVAQLKSEVENKSSSYAANPDCTPCHAHASVQPYSIARTTHATSRHSGRKLGEPNHEASMVHHHSPPHHVILIVCAIVPSAFTGFVCHMLPSRHNGRLPPSWGPEREGYAFSQWARDVLLWCIMSDWDSSRKCAAILSQLTGSAQEYARQIPPQTIITGGTINGIACDSVTFLMHELSSRFGRLSEETRLESIGDLFDFRSRPGERIDSVLERFDACRAKAAEQGRLTVSYEGLSWILLRAINVSDHQLVQLLLPFNGMMPNSQEQLNQLRLSLRRMGHILEGSPGNVSQSMRSTAHQYVSIPTDEEPRPSQSHAWPQAQSSGFLSSSQHSWQQDPTAQWSHHQHDAFAAFEDASGTDTDTSSDDDESWGPDLSSMTEDEVTARAQELFWAYARAKKQWRAFTQKPTRKVRRFLRKRGFKGKGKGKPKGYHGKGKPGVVSSTSYLADLSDYEIQSLFPAAVSQGRHWRKSTGKGGKGRRGNPRGPDGRQMQCHSCGSVDHLVAKCPRRQSQQDRPNLFVYINPAPILATNPAQPQPGAISSATILMVTPGDEPSSGSQNSQNDAWQNARMPQLPRRSTEAQSQDAWSNYHPPSSQHASVAQTPARSHGPVIPPSPVPHMSIPAQDSHQSFMQSLFGRFLEAGRPRHPHNMHASPTVNEAREEDAQFEPLLPETVQPPRRSSHRSPQSERHATGANTRLPRASANQSQQPQAIHLTAPVPELPPWALLPEMEFLHGVRSAVPQHVSPYPSVVVSSLDQFGLQGIEEFHQAGRLMAVRSEDRPPGLVASQDSDPMHGQETQIWYDAGEALRTRQRTVRNRDREELEERVRAAIEAQQASEAEETNVSLCQFLL